jgi:hypothetical protein
MHPRACKEDVKRIGHWIVLNQYRFLSSDQHKEAHHTVTKRLTIQLQRGSPYSYKASNMGYVKLGRTLSSPGVQLFCCQQKFHNIVMCRVVRVTKWRVLARMIGFISTSFTHSLWITLKYRKYSAIADLHTHTGPLLVPRLGTITVSLTHTLQILHMNKVL